MGLAIRSAVAAEHVRHLQGLLHDDQGGGASCRGRRSRGLTIALIVEALT
jgi:hypothetical protein